MALETTLLNAFDTTATWTYNPPTGPYCTRLYLQFAFNNSLDGREVPSASESA